jgi:hypothetical protein
VLGVPAWLIFFFFVWLVVWSICCLLGTLLCKCIIQWLRPPPQPLAHTARSSPKRRGGPCRIMVRQFPPGLRTIPSLKTCRNGKRYFRNQPNPAGSSAHPAPGAGQASQDLRDDRPRGEQPDLGNEDGSGFPARYIQCHACLSSRLDDVSEDWK